MQKHMLVGFAFMAGYAAFYVLSDAAKTVFVEVVVLAMLIFSVISFARPLSRKIYRQFKKVITCELTSQHCQGEIAAAMASVLAVVVISTAIALTGVFLIASLQNIRIF